MVIQGRLRISGSRSRGSIGSRTRAIGGPIIAGDRFDHLGVGLAAGQGKGELGTLVARHAIDDEGVDGGFGGFDGGTDDGAAGLWRPSLEAIILLTCYSESRLVVELQKGRMGLRWAGKEPPNGDSDNAERLARACIAA